MSAFNDIEFNEKVKGEKTEALIEVLSAFFERKLKNILVVGCGSGREAGMLARAFGADVVGIDLGDDYTFDHQGSAPAKLFFMDAREMTFPCNSFDMVFSFHTLEHIPEPQRALKEMSRVLRSGGIYMVGTPNKSRLIGGFTSPYPLRLKVLWGLQDLHKRLTGQWSNEAGAHAGFTRSELSTYCSTAFGDATDISDLYYRSLYKRRSTAIGAIIKSGLKNIIFPCVYVAGTKSTGLNGSSE
jgi:SAM-dependent methyltransferase